MRIQQALIRPVLVVRLAALAFAVLVQVTYGEEDRSLERRAGMAAANWSAAWLSQGGGAAFVAAPRMDRRLRRYPKSRGLGA